MRWTPCVASAVLAFAASAQQRAPELDLAVLYAGAADHPRTEKWLAFLAPHVRRAEAIPLTSLSAETSADFDVVIVDAPSPYQPDGTFAMPKTPELGLDFTKPTIVLGAAGGAVLSRLQIKLDWL